MSELEDLREQVATLSALVERTVSRVEQDHDETATAIAHLEHAWASGAPHPNDPDAGARPAGEGEGGDGDEDEVPDAVAWVDYATGQDWAGLCDWVDWLVGVYDLHDERRVRPCWPAHLGVAEELAALHSAWREAASRAREADGDALAFWHDRYLTPLMGRINPMYAIGFCRDKHTPMRAAPVTNRTLIDVRSAADPDDTNPDDTITGNDGQGVDAPREAS